MPPFFCHLDDARWLTGDQGRELLDWIAAEGIPELKLQRVLRKEHSAERVRLLLTQSRLRERATAKFPQAGQMFFTPRSLEQATDAWVAAYKARRFTVATETVDLCCGIGGDLLGVAQNTACRGIDADPVVAHFAQANLESQRLTNAGSLAECQRVEKCRIEEYSSWHIDPDRRPEDRRSIQLIHHNPPQDVLETIASRNPHGAVKLAPATQLTSNWEKACEREWISRERSCRQQVAWQGELAREPGIRTATILNATGDVLGSISGQGPEPEHQVSACDDYLYEPDPAVLAAQLEGFLAASRKLHWLDSQIPFFTSSRGIADRCLQAFRVSDLVAFDRKKLAKLLRERDIGNLEIKTRGVKLSPERLRAELKLRGDRPATLFVTRIEKQHVAILADRIKLPLDS